MFNIIKYILFLCVCSELIIYVYLALSHTKRKRADLQINIKRERCPIELTNNRIKRNGEHHFVSSLYVR